MFLNDCQIKTLCQKSPPLIDNFCPDKAGNPSYGVSSFGYDARLSDEIIFFNEFDREQHRPLRVGQPVPAEAYRRVIVKEPTVLLNPGDFILACTMEYFHLPKGITGLAKDKSTLARMGIAVQNTVLEAGWEGQLTLEITNGGRWPVELPIGQGITQILFALGDEPLNSYIGGKYQYQRGPVLPR